MTKQYQNHQRQRTRTMIKRLKKLWANYKRMREADPVFHCEFYKKNGCTHVDGYLCDMPSCEIRADYLESITEQIER